MLLSRYASSRTAPPAELVGAAFGAGGDVVHDLLGLEGLPGLGDGGEQRLQVGTRTAAPERTTPGSAPGTESGGQQRVRVEYQLLGPLSLVGERGMSGGYAAGVVLRLRFR